MKDHFRHSKKVTSTRRWQSVRHAVLERDGWKCIECGSRRRLEVDHRKPVRTHPELAYDPANLATLCAHCHTSKTRIECGHKPVTYDRLGWRKAVSELEANPNQAREVNHA